MAENKLYIINDNAVTNIMNDPKVLGSIYALKIAVDNAKSKSSAGMKSAGCRPCQAKARNLAINLMIVKRAIARLSDADKVKLKGLLKADQARIVYSNESGKIILLTF